MPSNMDVALLSRFGVLPPGGEAHPGTGMAFQVLEVGGEFESIPGVRRELEFPYCDGQTAQLGPLSRMLRETDPCTEAAEIGRGKTTAQGQIRPGVASISVCLWRDPHFEPPRPWGEDGIFASSKKFYVKVTKG